MLKRELAERNGYAYPAASGRHAGGLQPSLPADGENVVCTTRTAFVHERRRGPSCRQFPQKGVQRFGMLKPLFSLSSLSLILFTCPLFGQLSVTTAALPNPILGKAVSATVWA